MNLSCFSSSDVSAVNASVVYDSENDVVNLWSAPPAPACPPPHSHSPSVPPPSPSPSRCLVCLHGNGTATVVCDRLRDGVKLIMEAASQPVHISESECPNIWSSVDLAPSSDGMRHMKAVKKKKEKMEKKKERSLS